MGVVIGRLLHDGKIMRPKHHVHFTSVGLVYVARRIAFTCDFVKSSLTVGPVLVVELKSFRSVHLEFKESSWVIFIYLGISKIVDVIG